MHNRVLAACIPGYDSKLILGAEFNAKESLRFKSMEGTTEALPQLVLQLYIIARRGLCLGKTGGKKRERADKLFPTFEDSSNSYNFTYCQKHSLPIMKPLALGAPCLNFGGEAESVGTHIFGEKQKGHKQKS